MPHNFDVVCVGSAKIDIFLTLHEANKHLRLIPKTNELCLKFGEKITVDKGEVLLGGNASNLAVGLSRLGLKTTIVAEIGSDEFAHKIISTLSNENVDIYRIQKAKEQQSSFSVILNFKGERTIFSEHVKRDHNFDFDNLTTNWVYLTSLGKDWHQAYDKTFDFVKTSRSKLAFNPGTIQINEGYKSIENILSLTDILFLNKEEAEKILSIKYKVLSIEEILKGLQKLGPKIVVITDGKNGSYTLDERGNFYQQGITPSKVVEKTGAGDAYSAGFLGAILNSKSIQEAMAWGARNAASVISKIGAQAGLLRKEEIGY